MHQRNTDILVKAQMKSYEKQVEGTDSGKGSFRGIQPRNENDPLKVNVAPKDGNADDNEDDGVSKIHSLNTLCIKGRYILCVR